MRQYRFGATSPDDSRLTEALSRVFVAFLVHRSADVATALCATDITISLMASRVKHFGRIKIMPRRTCTPEQAVLVQTVKSLGTLVAPSGRCRRLADALAGFGVANADAAEYAGHKTVAF